MPRHCPRWPQQNQGQLIVRWKCFVRQRHRRLNKDFTNYLSVSYFLRPSNTSSPLTIMFHCVCVCLYSFLVRTGNKTPNFIMGHYDKSHTLDICSNPLLLEILKNNLSFHPLPDSALGVGTCSWPVAAEHRNSTIQAGQGAGNRQTHSKVWSEVCLGKCLLWTPFTPAFPKCVS